MQKPGDFANRVWSALQTLRPVTYECGYCGYSVSSEKGYKIHYPGHTESQHGGSFICPRCLCPTFFPPDEQRQVPGPTFGHGVKHVPSSLNCLYEEARSCVADSSFTASVLVCRKMLMNIAVEQG